MNDLSQAEFDDLLPEAADTTIHAQEVCLTASGLRQLADLVERFSAAGLSAYVGNTLVYVNKKDEFRAACRILGHFSKTADDSYFNATRALNGDVRVQVYIARADMIESLNRYAKQRVPLGGFLTYVVENNLSGALGKADEDNMANLPAIVAYCYNKLPSPCWGSPEKVKAWLEGRAETGAIA